MAAGQPTKYRAELCDEFIALRGKGCSVEKVAAIWDISKQTIYQWREDQPKFSDAFTRAEVKYVAFLEDALWRGLYDKNFKEGAFKFLAMRVGWSDKAADNRQRVPKHKDGFNAALTDALENGLISPSAFESIQSGLTKAWERENGEKSIEAAAVLKDAKKDE